MSDDYIDYDESRADRTYEVVAQYLIHGDKAADIMGIKENTLRRYIRRGKALGLDIE